MVIGSANAILGEGTALPSSAGTNWAGLELNADYRVRLQARISGDVTGDVKAREVVRVDIGGNLDASLWHYGPASTMMGLTQIAGSIGVSGGITSTVANIDQINIGGNLGGGVFVGDLIGPDFTPGGRITNLDVGGTISGRVKAAGGIQTLKAAAITRWAGQSDETSPTFQPINAQIFAIADPARDAAIDSILVLNGSSVQGDIGAPGSPVVIRTLASASPNLSRNNVNGAIKSIRARSAYVDIETPSLAAGNTPSSSNQRGDVRELILNRGATVGSFDDGSATAGVLSGRIKTFSIGFDSGDPDPSFDLGGALIARIILNGTIKQPFIVRRDGVSSTGTIALLRQDLAASDDEGISITGDMAGVIEVDGSKKAPISVSGDVSGLIDIGKSIQGTPALTPDFGGRVDIGGDLTGSIRIGGSILEDASHIEIEVGGDMLGSITIGKSLEGQIVLHPSQSLKGQIVINKNNGSGSAAGIWTSTGLVKVGPIELKTTASQPYQAPYYRVASSTLGGGAVGLAPFHLYEYDCLPAHDGADPIALVLSSDFADLSNFPVKMAMYGPATRGGGSSAEVKIEVQNPGVNGDCDWADMTQLFSAAVLAGDSGTDAITSPRIIGLRGTGNAIPYEGLYRVTINSNRLVSSGIDGTDAGRKLRWPQVEFGEPGDCPADVYIFRIGFDCNGNHRIDSVDITLDSSLDTNLNGMIDACEYDVGNICRCDWNESSAITVQDIFDFLASYFAGNGDFNFSGTTTVQDIFDFLTCYFNPPPACAP